MHDAPLAYRLRPKTLAEFFGQTEVIGEGTQLRSAIESDQLSSIILAGPPGTGKTTLAHIIAESTKREFRSLSAVESGVKDIKDVCKEARASKEGLLKTRGVVLFIDEIHRFNKSQQDALLPFVENGDIVLVGATTENPYFSVNSAIISRSQVFLLKSHSIEELLQILSRALSHPEGFDSKIKIQEAALRVIAEKANGDARRALNLLETVVLTLGANVTFEQAQKIVAAKALRYDKTGEDHYDTVSAFIKSMRGSDADAALLWMWKMLKSGEDPRLVFRRMMIFASEDIGPADLLALQIVVAAFQAYEMVGLPEGEYFLAHACTYLSSAKKSNAVKRAMESSKAAIESAASLEVPYHLRNAPVAAMRDRHEYGKNYKYPHDFADAKLEEHYFPIGVQKPSEPFWNP